jgi:hypothetical protein
LKIFNLNELAYTELILSIDVKTSSGKIAFNMVKGCKNKDYTEGNATMAWERLKNKYEPTSAPSLVKTEILFRQRSLTRNEDPDAWITYRWGYWKRELETNPTRLKSMNYVRN